VSSRFCSIQTGSENSNPAVNGEITPNSASLGIVAATEHVDFHETEAE
jgi:hypothetical protein